MIVSLSPFSFCCYLLFIETASVRTLQLLLPVNKEQGYTWLGVRSLTRERYPVSGFVVSVPFVTSQTANFQCFSTSFLISGARKKEKDRLFSF